MSTTLQPALREHTDLGGQGYTNLVVAVVSLAVEVKGVKYLSTRDGEWWLGLIGLEGDAIQARLSRRIRKAK